jgi:hypothetical protein
MINQLQGEGEKMLNSFTFQKIKTKRKMSAKLFKEDWKLARRLQRRGKLKMQVQGMLKIYGGTNA